MPDIQKIYFTQGENKTSINNLVHSLEAVGTVYQNNVSMSKTDQNTPSMHIQSVSENSINSSKVNTSKNSLGNSASKYLNKVLNNNPKDKLKSYDPSRPFSRGSNFAVP